MGATQSNVSEQRERTKDIKNDIQSAIGMLDHIHDNCIQKPLSNDDQTYDVKNMRTDLHIAIDIIEHINEVCNRDERLPVITNGELVLSMLKLHMENLMELKD